MKINALFLVLFVALSASSGTVWAFDLTVTGIACTVTDAKHEAQFRAEEKCGNDYDAKITQISCDDADAKSYPEALKHCDDEDEDGTADGVVCKYKLECVEKVKATRADLLEQTLSPDPIL